MKKPSKKSAPKKQQKLTVAARICEQFGFTPIAFETTNSRKLADKVLSEETRLPLGSQRSKDITARRIASLIYAEQHGVQGAQPMLSYHIEHSAAKKVTTIYAEILGIPRGVAEAILTATAEQIIKAEFDHAMPEQAVWRVSCIGEKENFARFERDFTQHIRKHLNTLPTTSRESFKEYPLSLLESDNATVRKVVDEGPQPITFLSDVSRDFFKEVLQYFEGIPLSYEMSHRVLPHFSYESHALAGFDHGHVRGWIARYGALGKKSGNRRDIPAVGLVLEIDKSKTFAEKITPKPQPSLYLMHAGPSARIRAVRVLSDLAHAGLMVHSGILKDKLSSQMMSAETMHSEYILLIGQKEFVEKSVVVRNTVNRSERPIPLAEIPTYIKGLKKA